MREIYSKDDDCQEIAKKLNRELGEKICYLNFVSPVIGEYACLPYQDYHNFEQWDLDKVSFYFKYCDGEFLRVGIGNGLSPKTVGHKLAALSDFYQVFSEEFGNPTLFYTTQDDEEGFLNLQWSFQNRLEDVCAFQNGTAFDNASIDTLIIMEEYHEDDPSYQLFDATRAHIVRKIGLPFELINFTEEYIEDFVKYKSGDSISCPPGPYRTLPSIKTGLIYNKK